MPFKIVLLKKYVLYASYDRRLQRLCISFLCIFESSSLKKMPFKGLQKENYFKSFRYRKGESRFKEKKIYRERRTF